MKRFAILIFFLAGSLQAATFQVTAGSINANGNNSNFNFSGPSVTGTGNSNTGSALGICNGSGCNTEANVPIGMFPTGTDLFSTITVAGSPYYLDNFQITGPTLHIGSTSGIYSGKFDFVGRLCVNPINCFGTPLLVGSGTVDATFALLPGTFGFPDRMFFQSAIYRFETPEPATFPLTCIGIAAFAFGIRRRKAEAVQHEFRGHI